MLRPGGRLLLTTPNRRTFPPGNPFHSRELDPAELADLVAAHLEVDAVEGLHHGPRLRAADDAAGRRWSRPSSRRRTTSGTPTSPTRCGP